MKSLWEWRAYEMCDTLEGWLPHFLLVVNIPSLESTRVHKIDIVVIHNVKNGNSWHACSISLVVSEMQVTV